MAKCLHYNDGICEKPENSRYMLLCYFDRRCFVDSLDDLEESKAELRKKRGKHDQH